MMKENVKEVRTSNINADIVEVTEQHRYKFLKFKNKDVEKITKNSRETDDKVEYLNEEDLKLKETIEKLKRENEELREDLNELRDIINKAHRRMVYLTN